jgi:hypothetical protein
MRDTHRDSILEWEFEIVRDSGKAHREAFVERRTRGTGEVVFETAPGETRHDSSPSGAIPYGHLALGWEMMRRDPKQSTIEIFATSKRSGDWRDCSY